MKIALFGTLALVLSCSLAIAQPAPPVESDAQVLFKRCRAAYAALTSYRGTTETTDLTLLNGSPSIGGGKAKISFQKPGLLRVDGKLEGGDDFSILGNAEGSWYRWPLENNGNWEKVEELSLAIAAMTGVASSAPTTIPALLIGSEDLIVFEPSKFATIEQDEEIDGEMCYKITARAPEEMTSWWINKKTLLLRRIVGYTSEEQSAKQLAELAKEMAKMNKDLKLPPEPKIDMRLISSMEDFEVEAINEPVDEALFDTVK